MTNSLHPAKTAATGHFIVLVARLLKHSETKTRLTCLELLTCLQFLLAYIAYKTFYCLQIRIYIYDYHIQVKQSSSYTTNIFGLLPLIHDTIFILITVHTLIN